MMSLMSMLSTWTPQPAATSSMISPMDWATSSRRSITSWRMRAPMTWHNVVVDDRGQAQGDVVLGHADLLGDLCDLDLDIDLDQTLGEGVDLDEAGIDGLVESTKLGDETDVALVDALVWVGADDAAGDGAQGTNDGAKGVDHAPVPALGAGLGRDGGCVAALQILLLGRLDFHLVGGLEADDFLGCLGGRALAVHVGRTRCARCFILLVLAVVHGGAVYCRSHCVDKREASSG